MKVEAAVKKGECLKVALLCLASKKWVILNVSIMVIQHIFNLKVNRSRFYSSYSSYAKYESKHLEDDFLVLIHQHNMSWRINLSITLKSIGLSR